MKTSSRRGKKSFSSLFARWQQGPKTIRGGRRLVRGDGAFLVCARTDGTYVFETTNWNQRTTVRSDDQFFTMAFHPHRPILAVPTTRIRDHCGREAIDVISYLRPHPICDYIPAFSRGVGHEFR